MRQQGDLKKPGKKSTTDNSAESNVKAEDVDVTPYSA